MRPCFTVVISRMQWQALIMGERLLSVLTYRTSSTKNLSGNLQSMNEYSEDIRFLSRKEIAPEKWDQCISGAKNSLIYARSFYLDRMAKNWSALVLNDYEAVMPLTWN